MAPSLEAGTAGRPEGVGRKRLCVCVCVGGLFVEGSWQFSPPAATRIILVTFLAWFLPGLQATASCPQWGAGGRGWLLYGG